jgi:hypothetical protein
MIPPQTRTGKGANALEQMPLEEVADTREEPIRHDHGIEQLRSGALAR